MLAVLSPAKTLDEETPVPEVATTEPRFAADAVVLARAAARLSPRALGTLMNISPTLARLNVERFRAFAPAPDAARPALYTFDGDVYAGLAAATLGPDAVAFAQAHVRILSGLYGVLRPLDLMQPYRLEMHSKLKAARQPDLYAYWGKRIGAALAAELSDHRDRTLINLASKEYFAAVATVELPGAVIDIDFRDETEGALRFNTFVGKRARGAMARFICTERIDRPAGLKDFAALGYTYRPEHSDGTRWAFVRAPR